MQFKNRHIHMPRNTTGKDFIIGDLHGCYTKLLDAMNSIDFDKSKDRLFCVGDLVDRGPDSLSCLTLLTEKWFHSVLGNHDQFFVDGVLYNHNIPLWFSNGGRWADDLNQNTLIHYARMVENLPLSITIDNKIGICHADPSITTNSWNLYADSKHFDKQRLWGRHCLSHDTKITYNDIDISYHGHTPVERPVTLGQARFIDTGACFGYKLTIEELKY